MDDMTSEASGNPSYVHAVSPDAPGSVLGKAHMLLAAFTSGPSTMGLAELSRRSGVPKASAHRLAVELAGLGMLSRTPAGYQLGWRIFELGQLVPMPANLRAIARPALMDLRTQVHGVVHLAMPQGDDCVYLERLAGRRETDLLAAVGARVPNYSTASGLLFLAYADEQYLSCLGEKALRALGVQHYRQLDGLFGAIRDRRYSYENQQCVPGFKTTAVPVFDTGSKQVVASISVTMPSTRRDEQQIVRALWAAAHEISKALNYPAPETGISPRPFTG